MIVAVNVLKILSAIYKHSGNLLTNYYDVIYIYISIQEEAYVQLSRLIEDTVVHRVRSTLKFLHVVVNFNIERRCKLG